MTGVSSQGFKENLNHTDSSTTESCTVRPGASCGDGLRQLINQNGINTSKINKNLILIRTKREVQTNKLKLNIRERG